MQHGQVFCQTARHGRLVGMYALNFRCLQDQLRHLFTVAVVVTHDDMVDDFRERGGAPVFFNRLFGQQRQLRFDSLHVQFLARGRSRQRLLTAAAVIHIVFTEQRGSARDGERQLAEGVVAKGHSSYLVIKNIRCILNASLRRRYNPLEGREKVRHGSQKNVPFNSLNGFRKVV